AAARQDAADMGKGQRSGSVFQHAAPALEEANEFVFVVEYALAHHGANDCVETWAVATASQNANLHGSLLEPSNLSWTQHPHYCAMVHVCQPSKQNRKFKITI